MPSWARPPRQADQRQLPAPSAAPRQGRPLPSTRKRSCPHVGCPSRNARADMMSGLPQGRSGPPARRSQCQPWYGAMQCQPWYGAIALSLVRRYPMSTLVRRYPIHRCGAIQTTETYTPEPGENIPYSRAERDPERLSLGLEPGPLLGSGTRPVAFFPPTPNSTTIPVISSQVTDQRPAMGPGSFCQEYFFSSAMVADASASPRTLSVALIHSSLSLHDSRYEEYAW